MKRDTTLETASKFSLLPDEAQIDIRAVILITGISKSAWYDGIKVGKYPRQVKTGKKGVRWIVGEIREALEALKAARY